MSPRTTGPAPALTISRLEDGDTRTIERVFAQLSLESVFHRFGTGMSVLPPRFTAALAAVAPGRQQVLVARVGGTPVGVARWTGRSVAEVEVALEVADAWHGAGIGRRLVREVALDARAAGVGSLQAHVVPGNTRVHAWLSRLGMRGPVRLDDPYRLPVDTLLDRMGVSPGIQR